MGLNEITDRVIRTLYNQYSSASGLQDDPMAGLDSDPDQLFVNEANAQYQGAKEAFDSYNPRADQATDPITALAFRRSLSDINQYWNKKMLLTENYNKFLEKFIVNGFQDGSKLDTVA